MFRRKRADVSLTQALHRAEAVLNVLDEDLRQVAPLLQPPPDASGTELSAETRSRAEADLQAMERDLHQLEELAASAKHEAREWERRAALASEEGREDFTEQARVRVAEELRRGESFAAEIRAARALVNEWSAYLRQ